MRSTSVFARPAACMTLSRYRRKALPSAECWYASSPYPRIAPRMLLKSWAIPPASVPIASIFCDCLSCAWRWVLARGRCLRDAVFALVVRCTSFKMISQCGVEARHVVGVNDDLRQPCGASRDCTACALTSQRFHLRREEQPIRRDVPVPMPLIGSFHCERIALLAFPQRTLAGLDSPQLAQ